MLNFFIVCHDMWYSDRQHNITQNLNSNTRAILLSDKNKKADPGR
jgi:hypothetical protein